MKYLMAAFFALYLYLGVFVHADPAEYLRGHFVTNKLYQVAQDTESYYILSSSPFKDTYAKRNLALLAKATLFKFIKKIDKKITGLEFKEFSIEHIYEENNRIFAISSIHKNNVILLYNNSDNDKHVASFLQEIKKLKGLKSKNKTIHRQLKELYFLIGDIDNYEKQSDILMEIIFNED